jgi:hypothetical protein
MQLAHIARLQQGVVNNPESDFEFEDESKDDFTSDLGGRDEAQVRQRDGRGITPPVSGGRCGPADADI